MPRQFLSITTFIVGIVLICLLDRGYENLPPLGPLLCPASGYLQNGEPAAELSDQTLPDGLVGEQSFIVMDSHLIPHIFAINDLDAFRLQGFLHAKYRLWQMDFLTRVAAGRVSEAVGVQALEFDKRQRRKGLAKAAEEAVEAWKKYGDWYDKLEAYTAGINAYISTLSWSERPIEYKILGYNFEEWQPRKSALFFKHMADVLCSRERDFEMTNARTLLGDKMFDFLYPRYHPEAKPVIPSERQYLFEGQARDTLQEGMAQGMPLVLARPYPRQGDGLGSNNWAIAPQRTKSGHALLSNDPHLQLRLPSIWYLVHIHTPEYNTMGVSFPGMPGIILGFNEDVSWGVTNAGHDVLDWHEVDWVDQWKTYRIEGRIYPIDWRREAYEIKGRPALIDSVPWTILGPVWTARTTEGSREYIMRWIAHDTSTTNEMSVFIQINRARNIEDCRAAIFEHSSPAQNFVFASREGDISINVQGQLPLRKKGLGRHISEAGTSGTWHGVIPNEHLPSITNPDQGYLASANQVSTDSTYPYFYIDGDFRDPRAITINNILSEQNAATIADMKALQLNSFDKEGFDFYNAARTHMVLNRDENRPYDEWDGHFTADCEICPLVDLWRKHTLALIYDELVINGTKLSQYPPMWRTNDLIANDPDHIIFDLDSTGVRETASEILQMSYQAALREFNRLEEQVWHKYRNTRISHIIPSLTPFGAYDIPCDGTGTAPNAVRLTQGPSWRLIAEMGPEVRSIGVIPGGQSGHGGSRFYDDLLPLWIKGEYIELTLAKDPANINNAFFSIKSEK